MNEMLTFGARLKRLRIESKYKSQDDLAGAIGSTRQTIGKYESGDRKPDVEIIRKLSQALDVSADYLVGLSHVKAPNEDIQGVHKKTGLTEEAIISLSVNHDCGGDDYMRLLGGLLAHKAFPTLLRILGAYLSRDEYLDGCADTLISQLTQYDDALDEHLTRKAICKKIAEEYLWKIVDDCSTEEE